MKLGISSFSYSAIVAAYKFKNYPFSTSPFVLNITGFRSDQAVINSFDDYVSFIWHDKNGRVFSLLAECTTIPGITGLKDDLGSPKGTAIQKPGFYQDLWAIAPFHGYSAWVQVSNITVYRDKNLDGKPDYDEATLDTGLFGINLHRGSPDHVNYLVDNWSLGCTVVSNPLKFMIAIKYGVQQIKWAQKKKFDYALFIESEFALANNLKVA